MQTLLKIVFDFVFCIKKACYKEQKYNYLSICNVQSEVELHAFGLALWNASTNTTVRYFCSQNMFLLKQTRQKKL